MFSIIWFSCSSFGSSIVTCFISSCILNHWMMDGYFLVFLTIWDFSLFVFLFDTHNTFLDGNNSFFSWAFIHNLWQSGHPNLNTTTVVFNFSSSDKFSSVNTSVTWFGFGANLDALDAKYGFVKMEFKPCLDKPA